MYKIVRHFFNSNRKVTVATWQSLEQAQAWCSNPETSSSTCKEPVNTRRTRQYGPWFDGYTEQ